MKISTKGRYGLRAMLNIALHSEKEPVSIRSIADRENISDAYLEQLMSKLKKAGLIASQRGAQGGYRLAKPAEEISVGDILRSLEGKLDAVSCPGLQEMNSEEEGCAGAQLCVTKYVWKRINESITQAVDEIRLSTLVEESRRTGTPDAEENPPEKACCKRNTDKTGHKD